MLALHENALLAALQTHRDVSRLVRTVASLPRVFGKDLLQRYAVDAPALYVVPGRVNFAQGDATIEFTVAGVVRNVAGQNAARKGDGIDIGCDNLLVLALRAIDRQRLGQCSWSATSAEIADDELFDQAGISAIEIKFTSSVIEVAADYGQTELDQLDSFTRLHADLDIAPQAGTAEHAKWLAEPANYSTSSPDAQMDVVLPGAI